MRNCDIINAVFERDKSNNLLNQINYYVTMLNQGYSDIRGLEKIKELYEVLCKLEDENYQITQRDAILLRNYNVLVNPTNFGNKSFLVTSDFHGFTYPLDKIKNHYLNAYDAIYILGDVTDRGPDKNGTGSLKLLLDIMELAKQYPNRVFYVPGNHDEFLLGYMREKHHMDCYHSCGYKANLMYNGGSSTIKELDELERSNPRTYNELMSWLGRQPLQKVHKYNGKTYVLGHAVFNQCLYDLNPNYCLEDYFKESINSNSLRMAYQVLWFRKEKDRYNSWEMPSADKIMVYGHTREKALGQRNINLYDKEENVIKTHCVDGGIAYDGTMLIYDGGPSVIQVESMNHNNAFNTINSSVEKAEATYQNYILSLALQERTLGLKKAIAGYFPEELGYEKSKQIICEKYHCYQESDIVPFRNLYVKTVLFDYILKCQFERMQERYRENAMLAVSASVDRFLHGSSNSGGNNNYKGNYCNFTSHKNARSVAMAMGPSAMEEVLNVYDCKTVDEYVIRKFSQDPKGKAFAKLDNYQ